MLDLICYIDGIQITLKSHFWRKKVKIMSLCTQCCYVRHFITLPKSVDQTTGGLQISTNGVISNPDETSCDKIP